MSCGGSAGGVGGCVIAALTALTTERGTAAVERVVCAQTTEVASERASERASAMNERMVQTPCWEKWRLTYEV